MEPKHTSILEKLRMFMGAPENKKVVWAASLGVFMLLGTVIFACFYSVAAGSDGLEDQPSSLSVASDSSDDSTSALPLQDRVLKLYASSVEADLEVQVQDEAGELVEGYAFVLVITDKDGKEDRRSLDELDGFLYITRVAEGDYTIAMEPMEGFVTPEAVTCTVKPKVRYTVMDDIKDKVVDESKVEVSKEDASFGSNTTPTPSVPVDTVEYVASTKTEKTVEKDVTVTTYTPVLQTVNNQQHIEYASGVRSDVIVEKTADGYIAYRWVTPTVSGIRYAPNGGGLVSFLGGRLAGQPGKTLLLDSSQLGDSSLPADSNSPDPSQPDSSSDSDADSSTSGSDSSGSDSASPAPPAPVRETVALFDSNGVPVKDAQGNFIYNFTQTTHNEKVVEKVWVYTGWQTMEGKTYYFDKNGNKVTGSQVIQGVNYFFSADGTRSTSIGIDVSKYQGNINWAKVKGAGISFVMIRVGYRGYGTGALVEDPKFAANIRGATNAGLKVGVYFFSQAVNTQEAVEEASMAIKLVQGYNLAYPIAFDTEYVGHGARADGLSAGQRTQIAIAFCETVRGAGYTPCVYASKSWFLNQLQVSRLSPFKIWLAHYTNATNYPYHYDIWQHSSTGTVPGISTNVDMNISYMGY